MKFLVDIKGFHGSKLFSNLRVDDVSLHIEFDHEAFHTYQTLVENDGEAYWQFEKSFVFEVPDDDSQTFLEQRTLRISCYHDEQGFHGMASVDLHTIATGPLEHNLPFLKNNEEVGRIDFSVSMEQFSLVKARFLFLRINHLQPLMGHTRTHAFLRYGFYEAWKQHHQFKETSILDDKESPQWDELELEFMASIPRLLRGAIEIHVCHKGSLINDEYARCCITFYRSANKLLDPGHIFQIFGNVKYHDATVEGKLTLSNLPKYAQMVPHNQIQKPLHTETGIHNADPVGKDFEQPHVPVFVVDSDHSSGSEHAESPKNYIYDLPKVDANLWKSLQGGELNSNHQQSDDNAGHSSTFWKTSTGYEQL